MKQNLRFIISLFLTWVGLFIAAKLIFMLCYHALYEGINISDICNVIFHGLKMDMATAGYLTALPAFIVTVSALMKNRSVMVTAITVYLAVMTFVVIAILMIDTALYGFWDFKLDITPLFYIVSNPMLAVASAPTWQLIVSPILLILLTWGFYRIAVKITGIDCLQRVEKCRATFAASLLLTALLFIPIRGGFGVATVNLSTAFFSNNMRLNHAAVNPAFSLLYSATHQKAFNKMFRFMDADTARDIMQRVTTLTPYRNAETPLLTTTRPDIYIIILESFSNSLFPSLGGEPIAVGLDSIAGSGLLMTNFYSSTFRTYRAIPSILNGFPPQPTTSILKHPEKTRHLASLAHTLGAEDYDTYFYYGGDATFANQLTYLLNTDFKNITTLSDFDSSIPTNKWGVTDAALFSRAADDDVAATSQRPVFKVIQTLSSHEPFDVPYTNAHWASDPACNAFAYTDSCVTQFVNRLAATPRWDNTLVILVPDHYGCYPHNPAPDDVVLRHRIPLIMVGGALALRGTIDTVASQVDIAATLLDEMNINRDNFHYSRNFLGTDFKPFAFMSTPTYTATVDSTGVSSVYNIESKLFSSGSKHPSTAADSINAAYLQTIYDTLHAL